MATTYPPHDFAELKDRLANEGEALPRRLKQVTAALLKNPDDIALSTAAQLAEKMDVQPSTLVRFAQVLGFRGFSELQLLFRNRTRKSTVDHRARLKTLTQKGTAKLFDEFAEATIASFEQARHTLDPEKIDAAVQSIADADTIYLIASGRTFPAATYAAYSFAALGIKAVLVDQIGGMGKTQLATASSADAVFAISFSPYASETLHLIDVARMGQTPIIAITDHVMSPLVPVADIWLELAEADYASFRSLSATYTLIMTLSVAVAKKRDLETPPRS
ncbi:MAG: MurR/RpiR family transcriptional regulator [Alphaproteobacteria bacterium]|nr:MurR/RpiR family transcriptional regulator [Alphaproteobacteria bacterium]